MLDAEGSTVRVGVDVGGTFTDVVVAGDDGVRVAKVPSTPRDQAEGVLDGVRRAGADLATTERFTHGTTVATNTVLERNGARTALVTTRGFRDLLTIGRQDRPSLYDADVRRPPPLVPADRVVEVDERVGADGEIVAGLDDDEARRVAAAVADLAPEAVAVCLLFSFLDDAHERRIEDAVAATGADAATVSRSSDVLALFREYERASTTTLNAYVAPRMRRYLSSLTDRLAAAGLGAGVEVMRSGGGTFPADLATRYPVHTLLSGPAGGAWGAAAVAAAAGVEDVIALDMGGTSADVTLITGGRPRTTGDGAIGGLPFAVSTTDIHTVGAGGGSIAWVDAGGALRVGPRSAGADPGPACYGRGGEEPTVTDANLLLGRLPRSVRLGGDLEVDVDAAERAVATLGDRIGMTVEEAAAGILRVVDAAMVKALRVVSVEKGHDPRRFTLVPFGGAGALHQAALADDLGCARVLVPRHPGVLSALGLLATPVTVEEARTRLVDAEDLDDASLEQGWDELADRARRRFEDQGEPVDAVKRTADLRYRGQAFELDVADSGAGVEGLVANFHDAHRERYGYDQQGEPVEVVNLRVRLEGVERELASAAAPAGRGADAARVGAEPVVVDGLEVEAAVYDRDGLGAGDRFDGPAIVTSVDATVYVAPGQRVEVDDDGNLRIARTGGRT